MLELFMLGSMAFTAGFATGWTLKTVARYRPNCHSDNSGDSVAAQGLRECEENAFDRFPPTMILEPAEWTANEGKYRRMAKEPEEIVTLEQVWPYDYQPSPGRTVRVYDDRRLRS